MNVERVEEEIERFLFSIHEYVKYDNSQFAHDAEGQSRKEERRFCEMQTLEGKKWWKFHARI